MSVMSLIYLNSHVCIFTFCIPFEINMLQYWLKAPILKAELLGLLFDYSVFI